MSSRCHASLFTLICCLFAVNSATAAENPPSPQAPIVQSPLTANFTISQATCILVASGEKAWVGHAASDLQEDILELTGLTVEIHSNINDCSSSVILIGTKGTEIIDDLMKKGAIEESDFDAAESAVLKTLSDPWDIPNVTEVMVITGYDSRGTMYGVYTFTEEYLGTDPLKFWTGFKPQHRDTVALNIDRKQKSPTFRLRGFFINDEDLLQGWKGGPGIEIEVFEEIFETMARLKYNTAIPRTWGSPDDAELPLAVDRGFYLTQHHIQYLGAEMQDWNKHWAPEVVDYSFTEKRTYFESFWLDSINEWKRYPGIVWQLGFRGRGDMPFWHNNPGSPETSEGRGEVIENAIDCQIQLLKDNVEPDPQFYTSTLWMEMVDLYKTGHVVFPDDVTLIWCDNGMGSMRSMSNDYIALPDEPMGGNAGVYYHVDFQNGWYNQLCQTVSPDLMRQEFCKIIDKECTGYLMLNVGDIRHVVMGIKAISEIGWDASPWYDNDNYADLFYDQWCNKYFGNGAAETAKQSYRALFDSPWKWTSKGYDEKAGIQGLMSYAQFLMKNKYSTDVWWAGLYGSHTTDGHIDYLIEKCSSAFDDWDKASSTAEKTLALIPADRQQFFKDDVKLQIEISRACNKYLYHLCHAVKLDKNAEHEKAIAELNAAISMLEHVFAIERDAEWGKWSGWFRNDGIAGVPRTYKATMQYRDLLSSRTKDD